MVYPLVHWALIRVATTREIYGNLKPLGDLGVNGYLLFRKQMWISLYTCNTYMGFRIALLYYYNYYYYYNLYY